MKIPPLADVRDLIAASMEIEKSEEENLLPAKKRINQLVMQGSSLDGAGSKASVMGEDKTLYVAKSLLARMIMMPDYGSILLTYLHRRPDQLLGTLKSCPLEKNTIRCCPAVSIAHKKNTGFISPPQ